MATQFEPVLLNKDAGPLINKILKASSAQETDGDDLGNENDLVAEIIEDMAASEV